MSERGPRPPASVNRARVQEIFRTTLAAEAMGFATGELTTEMRKKFRSRAEQLLGANARFLEGHVQPWDDILPLLQQLGFTSEQLLRIAEAYVPAIRTQPSRCHDLKTILWPVALSVAEHISASGVRIPPYLDVLFAHRLYTDVLTRNVRGMRFEERIGEFSLEFAGLPPELLLHAAIAATVELKGAALSLDEQEELKECVQQARTKNEPLIPMLRALAAGWSKPRTNERVASDTAVAKRHIPAPSFRRRSPNTRNI